MTSTELRTVGRRGRCCLDTNPDGTLIDRKAFLAQIGRGSSVKNIREQETGRHPGFWPLHRRLAVAGPALAIIERLSRRYPRVAVHVVPANRDTLINRELPQRWVVDRRDISRAERKSHPLQLPKRDGRYYWNVEVQVPAR